MCVTLAFERDLCVEDLTDPSVAMRTLANVDVVFQQMISSGEQEKKLGREASCG